MKRIELHDVEYGECTVFTGEDGSMLMVDCGSMNQKLRNGDIPVDRRFSDIAERYLHAPERGFILTHFHRDHLCGFQNIIEKHERYFDRVFIPCSPLSSEGRPLLLEFALLTWVFTAYQSTLSQVNTSCVRIFRSLERHVGINGIHTLCAGESFEFCGTEYQILWPPFSDFPFSQGLISALEEADDILRSPFAADCQREFIYLKERFLSLYVSCCEAFSPSARLPDEELFELLGELEDVLRGIEEIKDSLLLTPSAEEIRLLLEDTSSAYSDDVNSASLVFHNIRSRGADPGDILMTGDITPHILSELREELYDSYNIIKAPHHGTGSGYSDIFETITASHILISNGDYHAGGRVCEKYPNMTEAVIHCTNNHACGCFAESGSCCNRLSLCYDINGSASLALKCPVIRNRTGKAPCGIVVIDSSGEKGCICD